MFCVRGGTAAAAAAAAYRSDVCMRVVKCGNQSPRWNSSPEAKKDRRDETRVLGRDSFVLVRETQLVMLSAALCVLDDRPFVFFDAFERSLKAGS